MLAPAQADVHILGADRPSPLQAKAQEEAKAARRLNVGSRRPGGSAKRWTPASRQKSCFDLGGSGRARVRATQDRARGGRRFFPPGLSGTAPSDKGSPRRRAFSQRPAARRSAPTLARPASSGRRSLAERPKSRTKIRQIEDMAAIFKPIRMDGFRMGWRAYSFRDRALRRQATKERDAPKSRLRQAASAAMAGDIWS
jgi:hypothetical protein